MITSDSHLIYAETSSLFKELSASIKSIREDTSYIKQKLKEREIEDNKFLTWFDNKIQYKHTCDISEKPVDICYIPNNYNHLRPV